MFKKLIPILGIIGIIGLVISIGILLVIPQFPVWLKIVSGISVVLTLLYIGFYWDKVTKWFWSAQLRAGANVTVFIVAVVATVCLINYLGVRHHKQFDLTKNKKFTLSEQTIKIVKTIQQPLMITAFYRTNNPEYDAVKTVLDEYKSLNPKIAVQFVDWQVNPAKAMAEGIRYDGTTIIEYAGKKERVTGKDEKDFTASILKITLPESKKLYFVTGHGEHGLDEFDETGYSQLKTAIEKENYQTASISLTQLTTMPADASVVIIAGPKREFLNHEIQLLLSYLHSGGKAIVLLDPAPGITLDPILSEWNIKADNDIVIDMLNYAFPNPAIPAVVEYPWHEITRSLERMNTVFPLTRSISIDSTLPSGLTVTPLIKSSENSWGLTDPKREKVDEKKDIRGPLNLAVTISEPIKTAQTAAKDTTIATPETRIVIFGDSDFPSNAFLETAGDRDLFLNSLAWLVEEPELVGIRAKEPEQRTMMLIGYQWRLIAFTSLLFLPFIVFLAGFAVWWKRR